MKIPIAKPVFGPEEIAAAAKPLESGWLVQGPFVAEFEEQFRTFIGAKHAVACSNGTTALHLANTALRLGPGDEVIVPSFTWIATPNSVVYCGATPVFVDIDLATFNIDVTQIERRITSRTKGLLPVHLFGLCANMRGILGIAKKHDLWVVEDAACAFGAAIDEANAGTLGDAAAFSFHPRKSITTGEGGMVTTESDEIAKKLRSLRDHGAGARAGEPAFLLPDYDEIGFNYRLTDLQAAVGTVQMQRAEWILGERRRRAYAYDQRIMRELPWLRRPYVPYNMTHAYQAYVCLFAPETPSLANVEALERRRNTLMAKLDARGIATRQGTHAPVLRAAYRQRGIHPADYPNAILAEKLSLALPLYPQMTDEEQEYVLDALREIGPC